MRRESVSAQKERFIESMGLFFERQGVPRIGGRILGLMLLAEKPLALGEIARLLQVSPASVSTNIRQLQTSGLVDPSSIPGDRRHYYVFNSAGWDHRLELAVSAMDTLSALCQEALASSGLKENPKLRDAVDFCDFYRQELAGAAERWRSRFVAKPRRQAPAVPPPARPRRSATRPPPVSPGSRKGPTPS